MLFCATTATANWAPATLPLLSLGLRHIQKLQVQVWGKGSVVLQGTSGSTRSRRSISSSAIMSSAAVKIVFKNQLTGSDPLVTPVTIVGQYEHLKALKYDVIKPKLGPIVNEEVFKSALESLKSSNASVSSRSVFLNAVTLNSLPTACSRYNAPSRANSLLKIAKTHARDNNATGSNSFIVLICAKSELFASVCALVKAFPMYNRKTGENKKTVANGDAKSPNEVPCTTIEILLVNRLNALDTDANSNNPQYEMETGTLDEDELQLFEDAAFAIRNAAKIVDIPCSEMHTDQFVEEAKLVGNTLGIVPTIIRGEELKLKGFGGIYGVGRAAEHPPALIVLSHTPQNATETVAWVGKGIVFDTGGLSLKSKDGMCRMKKDCGGAAAILNAFYLAVKQGFTQNLHAVLCVAENSIGPLATRPDDILSMYSGKTVEINNTDAEGRLVLADGVAYAQKNLNANIIVDMATLTGAQGIATGKYHAAVLTNADFWETLAVNAGRASGELVFPLVFAPELHFSEFKSSIADMKNSMGGSGNASASCAGLFIMSHIGFDFDGSWIHFDMAKLAEVDERATGFGVCLLNTLFGQMSSSMLLKKLSQAGGNCAINN